jgi:hypothetical protein
VDRGVPVLGQGDEVSEYQYYEFVAVDRPLNVKQMGELRALSTRAQISSTSFTNHYEWGDFRGSPDRLMERYFDAFLYLANWGTHRLMFRLPARLLDHAVAGRYCVGDAARCRSAGGHVVLDLCSEDEEGDWEYDGQGLLASILPVRAELAAGDLRALYLAWLGCVQAGEIDDQEPEPPVPAGLGALSAAGHAVAEYLRIDTDLLAVAAEGSTPLAAEQHSPHELERWVRKLPVAEKNTALLRVLQGDPHVRAELLRAHQDNTTGPGKAAAQRTVGTLLAAAENHRAERERRQRRHEAAERARRERAVAAAREQRLQALADRQEQAWRQVGELIATKRPREYDTAVELLTDLHTISRRSDTGDLFAVRLRALRGQHARKASLIERLHRAGLA